jgi:hypothetical protein
MHRVLSVVAESGLQLRTSRVPVREPVVVLAPLCVRGLVALLAVQQVDEVGRDLRRVVGAGVEEPFRSGQLIGRNGRLLR